MKDIENVDVKKVWITIDSLWIDVDFDKEKIDKVQRLLSWENIEAIQKNYHGKYSEILYEYFESDFKYEYYKNLFSKFIWDQSINASYEREDGTFLNMNYLFETYLSSSIKTSVTERLAAHKEAVNVANSLWDEVLTKRISFSEFLLIVHGELLKYSSEIKEENKGKFRENIMFISWNTWNVTKEKEIRTARIIFPSHEKIDEVMAIINDVIIPNINEDTVFIDAVLLHHLIVQTHPFVDWNWRLSRIILVSLLDKFWFEWAKAFTFISENYFSVEKVNIKRWTKTHEEKKYDLHVAKQNSHVSWSTLKFDEESGKILNYPSLQKYFWNVDYEELITDFSDLFTVVWSNIWLLTEMFYLNDAISLVFNDNKLKLSLVKKSIFGVECKKAIRWMISWHTDKVTVPLSKNMLKFLQKKWFSPEEVITLFKLFSDLNYINTFLQLQTSKKVLQMIEDFAPMNWKIVWNLKESLLQNLWTK